MRLPEFMLHSFVRGGRTYWHLHEDEWAITILNLTVAAAESELRPQMDTWLLELPLWHEQLIQNLHTEDYSLDVPPPWKAAVSYARSLMETVGEVVPAKAESTDELIHFSHLLECVERYFGQYFFETHLNS